VARERFFFEQRGEAENIKCKFRFCPKIAKHLHQPVISMGGETCTFFNHNGKLEEFQIYFRKIPLQQQTFLVVSVLSNSPWLPRNLKKCPK